MEAKAAVPEVKASVSEISPILGAGFKRGEYKVYTDFARPAEVPWNTPASYDTKELVTFPNSNKMNRDPLNPVTEYHKHPRNDYLANHLKLLTELRGRVPSNSPFVYRSIAQEEIKEPTERPITTEEEDLVLTELKKLNWCSKDEGTKTEKNVEKLTQAKAREIFPLMVRMAKKMGNVINSSNLISFSGMSPSEEANILFHIMALNDMYRGVLSEPSFASTSMDNYYPLFEWMCKFTNSDAKKIASEIADETGNRS